MGRNKIPVMTHTTDNSRVHQGYSSRRTTGKRTGTSSTIRESPDRKVGQKIIVPINMAQEAIGSKYKDIINVDQRKQIQSDLKQANEEENDLKQRLIKETCDNKENDVKYSCTKQSSSMKLDLEQAGIKHKTIKEYFSNLSPAVNAGNENMWQERARIEKDIQRKKMEGNVKSKCLTTTKTNIPRRVNAKRKLQFKETPKSLDRSQEILSKSSSSGFLQAKTHQVSLTQWLEDLCLSTSAVRKLLEEELEL